MNQLNDALNKYVRPQTPPVAVRMVTSQDELPERVRFPKQDMGLLMPLCQGISFARRYGFVVAMGEEDFNCPTPPLMLGFLPPKKRFLEGDFLAAPPIPSKELRAKSRHNTPRLEYGKYKYVVMAPIDRTTFEPHFVVLYISPAQLTRLVQGAVFMTGEVPQAWALPGGTCSITFARTMLEDDYQAVVPGAGERICALVQEHEVAFTIPASKMDELIQGFTESEKTGIFRYPTLSWLRFQVEFPEGYRELRDYLSGEGE